MNLYKTWSKMAYEPKTQEEYNDFWNEYIPKEQKIYEHLLENPTVIEQGSLRDLAEKFEMDSLTFVGFMDGINSSLKEEVDVESLTEDTALSLDLDFEKLYFNMHDAKADWLYSLPQWDDLLSIEKRQEIEKEYKKTKTIVKGDKIGRNDPCPCGSGKKYKKCCGKESV